MGKNEPSVTDGPTIKCVVWDLDNTLWRGTLLEDPQVLLRDEAVEVIRLLDERGILQSVASRSDRALAISKLEELGLHDYFLYPQVGWNPKSQSLGKIADLLRLSLDTFAFIDDEPVERAEVSFNHPEVLTIDPHDVTKIPGLTRMHPQFITSDSKNRRRMYQAQIEREDLAEQYEGPREDFLITLQMRMHIARANDQDLRRAEELTIRTHQLNSTGTIYGFEELQKLIRSDDHVVLIASLTDRFGSYGKVGLAIIERQADRWILRLLLMSCRVLFAGAGSVLLTYIRKLAREAGVDLEVEFRLTERNRMMFVTFRLSAFKEMSRNGDLLLLRDDLKDEPDFPDYVEVST